MCNQFTILAPIVEMTMVLSKLNSIAVNEKEIFGVCQSKMKLLFVVFVHRL